MLEMLTTEMASDEGMARSKLLARKHVACYEVWPEVVPVQGRPVKVGFELHLCPGCPRCVATFEDLRQIAESIVPKRVGSVRCEVRPYEPVTKYVWSGRKGG